MHEGERRGRAGAHAARVWPTGRSAAGSPTSLEVSSPPRRRRPRAGAGRRGGPGAAAAPGPSCCGSRAASWRATPIEPDLVGLRGDVVPGDPGAAARGRQQRGEHAHRGRLARPVGTQEPVDLALGDRGRPVDGADAALEGAERGRRPRPRRTRSARPQPGGGLAPERRPRRPSAAQLVPQRAPVRRRRAGRRRRE